MDAVAALKKFREQNGIFVDDSPAAGAKQPASFLAKRQKTIRETFDEEGTGAKIKERDIELRYFGSDSSNDDEEDDLDIALRRVRDIPLETYLSAEKADIVRKA